MEQTLLLNASYDALSIIPWQRAITLWARGRVEVVAEYEDRHIKSVTFTMKMPSVVRLLRYVKVKRLDHVPFTRANIYARDGFECQYCGESFASDDLTFDHVIPQIQGGRKDWTNIVTACLPCNRTKGGRTPEQAGMTLRSVPKRPESVPLFRLTIGRRNTPESWRSYLYWNVELES